MKPVSVEYLQLYSKDLELDLRLGSDFDDFAGDRVDFCTYLDKFKWNEFYNR